MTIKELGEIVTEGFNSLEARIDDLERSRDFMRGVWKAATVFTGASVVVMGIIIKIKLFP